MELMDFSPKEAPAVVVVLPSQAALKTAGKVALILLALAAVVTEAMPEAAVLEAMVAPSHSPAQTCCLAI
jgi:hypothetical protein